MPYTRKPLIVEAFAWDRYADQSTWPQWAKDFRGQSGLDSDAPLGMSGVGTLIVPGHERNALNGDYLVLVAPRRIEIYSPEQFAKVFDEVIDPAASAPVEAAPTPAVEPAKAKAPAAKADKAPAPVAEPTEAPATEA